MNKKKKAVLRKHRKAKDGKENCRTKKATAENWVYAVGRIRSADLDLLKSDLKESDLNRLTTVLHEKIDAGYLKVTLKTKEVTKSLLESSLRDGLLKAWNDRIRMQGVK